MSHGLIGYTFSRLAREDAIAIEEHVDQLIGPVGEFMSKVPSRPGSGDITGHWRTMNADKSLRFPVALLIAAFAIACGPPNAGDPLPGYVHLVADPPHASIPVTVWFRDPGGTILSTVFFEFPAGDPILIVFPSTPGNSALQVNDDPCDGEWAILSQVETDVILHLAESSCRVEVVGSHPFGSVHTDPQTEPKLRVR